MPSRNNIQTRLRAAVSVTQMARMLNLSRAAFYDHVRRGHFASPIYTTGTRRPLYTAELQSRNLEVKATQLGIDGSFILFYERQSHDQFQARRIRSRSSTSGMVTSGYRRRLEGLGLSGLTDTQIEQALEACFPQGPTGIAEGDVLRAIFRHFRRSNHA